MRTVADEPKVTDSGRVADSYWAVAGCVIKMRVLLAGMLGKECRVRSDNAVLS